MNLTLGKCRIQVRLDYNDLDHGFHKKKKQFSNYFEGEEEEEEKNGV